MSLLLHSQSGMGRAPLLFPSPSLEKRRSLICSRLVQQIGTQRNSKRGCLCISSVCLSWRVIAWSVYHGWTRGGSEGDIGTAPTGRNSLPLTYHLGLERVSNEAVEKEKAISFPLHMALFLSCFYFFSVSVLFFELA